MTATLHLGIRDAVAGLYLADAPLAAGRVIGNRDLPLANGVASQIHVFRVLSTPARDLVGTGAPIDWRTTVRTIVKARSEAEADALAGECYARVMAAQSLGGLAMGLDPGDFAWDQDEADTPIHVVVWDCSVLHRTQTNTITWPEGHP